MSAVFNRDGRQQQDDAPPPRGDGRRRTRTILHICMLLLLIAAGTQYVSQSGGPGIVINRAIGLLADCYSWGSAVIRTVLLGGEMSSGQPGQVVLTPETEADGQASQDPDPDSERVILAPERPPAEGEGDGTGAQDGDKRNAGGDKNAAPERVPPKKKAYRPGGVG